MKIDVNNNINIKNFLKACSKHPGVYQMYSDNNELLYIGKAKNLSKRLSSYFPKNLEQLSPKVASLVRQIVEIKITVTNTEAEALILECNLIKLNKPKYNILLRDDKSYPYICLSKHVFPRVFLFRSKNNLVNNKEAKNIYFGPYPNSYAAKATIKLLEQVFLIRSCTDSYFNNRTRACLLYQINRCSAPCVNYISKSKYLDNINFAKLFLSGQKQDLIGKLVSNMQFCSDKQDYEAAATLRDKISKLQEVFTKQYISISSQAYTKAIDVISIVFNDNFNSFALVIMQYRDGNLIGTKEFYNKNKLDQQLEFKNIKYFEELIISIIGQFYINLLDIEHSNKNISEIIINFSLSLENKKILTEIINKKLKINSKDSIKNNQIKTKWLDLAIKNAEELLVSKSKIDRDISDNIINITNIVKQFELLRIKLNLAELNKIECIDVSHTFGKQTIASCVVFDNKLGSDKKSYRRYNINNQNKIDDIGAIREVLLRRYKKILDAKLDDKLDIKLENMPNLILIDGGRAQVNITKKVMKELNIDLKANNIVILGITKGEGRRASNDRILDSESMEFINFEYNSPELYLLQQIRDEAHRFAIIGHRAKRSKEHLHSVLEDIPGIGNKRRKLLLTHMGGLQGLLKATLEQIEKIPGIGKMQARVIYDNLNQYKYKK